MDMQDKIRVLVADNYPLVRVGIRTIIEETDDIKVVGETKQEKEIVPLCMKLVPDVLLLGLGLRDADSFATVGAVQGELPQMKVIILGDCDTSIHVRTMVEANVDGYVLKNDAPESVVHAIQAVMRGEVWYSQAVVQQILALKRADMREDAIQLNPRERQILALVVAGWNNTQIAAELHLAEQTIKNYLSRIYRVLNVSTRAESIVWAINHKEKIF